MRRRASVLGYGLLEPPSKLATLGPHALPPAKVKHLSPISSIVLTTGCKFRCSYCPIPAYNQFQHRTKSPERIRDDFASIANEYRISNFFGTDDNFFNDRERTLAIAEPLAKLARDRQRPYCKIRWGTEATVHDTIQLQDHLTTIRDAGLNWLWMGVEDLTATLVKKGQNESKTVEAFRLLREAGIVPMPMMMHHDTQPLVSRKSNYGLVNQLQTLRGAGALYMQVLMLSPSPGSKWFADTYNSGLAFQSVGGEPIERRISDGGYVIASKHPRPWLKQLYLLAGYTWFFNPVRFLIALVWSKSSIRLADAETRPQEDLDRLSKPRRLMRRIGLKARGHFIDAGMQFLGMMALLLTYRRTLGWAWKLLTQKIEPATEAPRSEIPMRSVNGGCASHALPGTPTATPATALVALRAEPANEELVTIQLQLPGAAVGSSDECRRAA
ncbi:MAG: radical SAM protein [Planctomycetaceae bacterium]